MRRVIARATALLPIASRPALALIAAAALGAAACGGMVAPAPAASDAARASARWADADLDQLTAGRSLYLRKCSGCHGLIAPHSRTPESWPAAVEKMALKINLPDSESELITRYLVTMSELASPRAAKADAPAAGVGSLGEPQVDPQIR